MATERQQADVAHQRYAAEGQESPLLQQLSIGKSGRGCCENFSCALPNAKHRLKVHAYGREERLAAVLRMKEFALRVEESPGPTMCTNAQCATLQRAHCTVALHDSAL
ncbi:hypothetical protein CGC20_21035 [Leishmania donovani]|uniref:Uncharacterized protein n=1 Tax=Leishmania donovani TaxID=5661 RepID=A0A504XP22_LEIDO|nr:hypothetical protein CGC20_21035 [Leishmania donovani]